MTPLPLVDLALHSVIHSESVFSEHDPAIAYISNKRYKDVLFRGLGWIVVEGALRQIDMTL